MKHLALPETAQFAGSARLYTTGTLDNIGALNSPLYTQFFMGESPLTIADKYISLTKVKGGSIER